MSRSTQDKFEETMEAIAATYHMEVVNDRQWSNTGWISFQRETSFDVLGRIHYGFYKEYASFGGTIGKLEFKHPYVRSAEMQAVVDHIRESIANEYPRQDP